MLNQSSNPTTINTTPLLDQRYRYQCYTIHSWVRDDYYVVMDTWGREWISDATGQRIEFTTYADARSAIASAVQS